MNEHRIMTLAPGIACVILLSVSAISAQSGTDERSIVIGLRGGAFAPQDHSIQGFEVTTYDVGGSPTSLAISGFGPGGELHLQAGIIHGKTRAWMLEIGGRLQRRQSEMSLVPDGQWDRYDNEMTAAAVSLCRIHSFPIREIYIVPYMGMGIAAQLIRWETLHEPEGETRQWNRGESVVPGFQFSAGWKSPIYYDLFLDAQFRYSYCMGKMRIRNEDAGTETEYQKLNLGGFSLLLGLSINLSRHD
ncbi:hypothetical protein ACFL5M_06525 [Candidatus Neomarinimicrobiota bacterium]